MEIWTLVKANIRNKKGSFFSIVLLMAIISLSVTVILSLKRNTKESMDALWEKAAPGELTVLIKKESLTEDLLKRVEDSGLTEKVEDIPVISADASVINDITNGNALFMRKRDNWFMPYNDRLTGYADKNITINRGEIYIPIGIKTDHSCNIGDKMRVYTIYNHYYDFTIAGFLAEPVVGSETIGWKQAYVSDADFEQMYAEARTEELAHDSEVTADVHILQIYQSENADMTSVEFRRALNKETGIVDFAFGTLTMSESQKYTLLLTDIITAALLVFMLMLTAVVLIVMGHSISTGIQIGYGELGILKAQGFSKEKIRLVFICQYLFAELFGSLAGIVLSVPVMQLMKNIFFDITGILSSDSLALGAASLLIGFILVLSVLFIWMMTYKITKISPVRAISGGQETVYFDSLFQTGIHKKGIHAGLALRQLTSNGKRYIGILFIIAILVFFMMTVMVLGNLINSKTSLEAMGFMPTELSVEFRTELSDKQLEDIETKIEEYTPISHKYYIQNLYLSLNGEQTMCCIFRNPEEVPAISKGRAPLYDNEIVITDVLAEEYALHIGDEVTVTHKDEKKTYMITGFNQSMNDIGRVFFMSLEGSANIGIENIYHGGYSLLDDSEVDRIAAELNDSYGELIVAKVAFYETGGGDMYEEIINMAKALIYILSVVFAFVVVHMVCTKTFIQERRDIGIYKACGFTAGMLRLQFAVRFLLIAVVGVVIGMVFSIFLSGTAISQMLRLAGVSTIEVSYTPTTFILPTVVICICFFIFAYFASRKIKRVETKELVLE